MKSKFLKRVLPILLTVTMMSGTVYAEEPVDIPDSPELSVEYEANVSDFQYEIAEDGVTITGYTGNDAALEIPAAIEDMPVVRIGADAFASNATISQVILPDSLEELGEGAFYNCTELLGIDIPAHVTSIGWNTFDSCSKLQYIDVAEDNTTYTSEDGVLYSKDMKQLVMFPYGKASVNVADGVEVIGDKAFYMCHSLTEITLPNTLHTIALSAFYGCDHLTSIDFPESLAVIDDFAFMFCTGLTTVEIPVSVETIGERAFDVCNDMTDITILNPNCTIFDHEWTLPEDAAIHGYDNSTAQAYAQTYERTFISLGEAPAAKDEPAVEVESPHINISEEGEYLYLPGQEEVIDIGKKNETEPTYWRLHELYTVEEGSAEDYQFYYDPDSSELHLNGVEMSMAGGSAIDLMKDVTIVLEVGSVNTITSKASTDSDGNDYSSAVIQTMNDLKIAGSGKLYIDTELGIAINLSGIWNESEGYNESGEQMWELTTPNNLTIAEAAEIYITSSGDYGVYVSGDSSIQDEAVLDADMTNSMIHVGGKLLIKDSAALNARGTGCISCVYIGQAWDIADQASVTIENSSSEPYANAVTVEGNATMSGSANVLIHCESENGYALNLNSSDYNPLTTEWTHKPVNLTISDSAFVDVRSTGGSALDIYGDVQIKDATLQVENVSSDDIYAPAISAENVIVSGETANLIANSNGNKAINLQKNFWITDAHVTAESSTVTEDIYNPTIDVKDMIVSGNAVVTAHAEGCSAIVLRGDIKLSDNAVVTATNDTNSWYAALDVAPEDEMPYVHSAILSNNAVLNVETTAIPYSLLFELEDNETIEEYTLPLAMIIDSLIFNDSAALNARLINADKEKDISQHAVLAQAVYNNLTTTEKTINCQGAGELWGLYYNQLEGDGFVGSKDNCTEGTLFIVATPKVEVNGREVTFTCTTDEATIYYSTSSKLTYWDTAVTNGETVTLGNLHGTIYARAEFQGAWSDAVEFTVQIPDEENVTNTFNDIKETDWWINAVQYAYDNNIMAGTGESFKPNNKLTREQFVQVLYNHSKTPDIAGVENNFPDLKENQWYTNAVLWANKNDIASGNANGTFGIGKNITREQLALMLYKYAILQDYDVTIDEGLIDQYSDGTKVSDWATEALNWAVTQGIISGKGSGNDRSHYRLDPQGTATRAECASMMMKLLSKNAE